MDEVNKRQRNSSMQDNSVFMKTIRPCFTEFLITLIFVFLGVCCVSGRSSFIPLVTGFMVTVLIFMAGGISGGHFNPVITLGFLLAGEMTLVLAVLYFISQLLGAIAGAGLARAVLTKVAYEGIKGGSHQLSPDISIGHAILAEIIATLLLVLTAQITGVDSKNKTTLAPIAIGFSVVAGIYSIGPLTGGSLNPARSFGPAVVGSYWSDHYVYWVGPILGALLASAAYRLILASPDRLLFYKNGDMSHSATEVELGVSKVDIS